MATESATRFRRTAYSLFNIQALLSKVTNEKDTRISTGTRSLRPREQLEIGKRTIADEIRADHFHFFSNSQLFDESQTADYTRLNDYLSALCRFSRNNYCLPVDSRSRAHAHFLNNK